MQLKGVMMENESIRKQIETESEIQFELNLPSELPVKMDSLNLIYLFFKLFPAMNVS